MRSPADRLPLERVVRAVATSAITVSLGVTLWRMMAIDSAGGGPVAHVSVNGGVAARTRDSLAALARAGQRVTWSGPVAAIAATSEPVRDPASRTRLLVASDAPTVLADSLGTLDSLGAPEGTTGDAEGGALTTSGIAGRVRASVRTVGTEALIPVRLGAAPGRVLVLGRVGWESKFTIASLEEAGWNVDARLRLADTMWVTQGGVARARAAVPSVATHAAIVLLDSAVGADAAAIVRFVRAGGGLVLAGDGAAARACAALTSSRADTIVLARGDSAVSVVARRVAAGRVLQLPTTETWRWRMQAERDGPADHRTLWNRLVATAAAAPRETRTAKDPDADEAPLATLVHKLGPAASAATASRAGPPSIPAWLGALILLLLLAEWASRRTRGAP